MMTSLELPVQMMKGEPVSQSSDIFSYGMLLYEILTGELPFADAKTDVVVSSKIMSGEVRWLYFLHLLKQVSATGYSTEHRKVIESSGKQVHSNLFRALVAI